PRATYSVGATRSVEPLTLAALGWRPAGSIAVPAFLRAGGAPQSDPAGSVTDEVLGGPEADHVGGDLHVDDQRSLRRIQPAADPVEVLRRPHGQRLRAEPAGEPGDVGGWETHQVEPA